MSDVSPEKKALISRILDIEEQMFLTVPHEPGGGCRQGVRSFQVHRKSQFLTWSEATLKSYLNDLEEAAAQGVNLMTLKYARMGEQIEPLSREPELRYILERQLIWQREVAAKFPGLINQGRPLEEDQTDREAGIVSFVTYLRCELETYSPKTLQLLWNDIQAYMREGANLNEQLYRNLASIMGYESLEAAEASTKV